MRLLFNIITYSIGNLFLGIIFTLVGVILMFFLIRSWFAKDTFTPLSFIIGTFLFLLLSFQSVLLCGAITIKSYSSDIEVAINEWMKQVPEQIVFNKEKSQNLLTEIQGEWPLVGMFIGGADFTGHTPLNIAHAISSELKSYMDKYIWRRIGWGMLFVLTGAFTVIKSMEHSQHTRSRYRSRSSRSAAGRSRRRRYDD